MKIVKIEDCNLTANVAASFITANSFTERFSSVKEINGKTYWIYLMTNKQYRKWVKAIQEHRLF